MQPTVEMMIQDNYTTLKNDKQQELYYCQCHSLKTHIYTHTYTVIIILRQN